MIREDCGCAITDRLDLTNRQLATANGQLATADQRTSDMQANLHQVNQQLLLTMGKLDETNRKMNTVERAVLQSPLLRPRVGPTPPTEPIPPTSPPVPR